MYLIYFLYMQMLQPFRIYMHNPLSWDEWYTLFIRRASFLPLAKLINIGLLIMKFAVLSTLVDR
jgi:hypothetical protein